MDGMFTMGMQGFGLSKVRGRSRVPSPPHMMQTFIEEYGFGRVIKGTCGESGILIHERIRARGPKGSGAKGRNGIRARGAQGIRARVNH